MDIDHRPLEDDICTPQLCSMSRSEISRLTFLALIAALTQAWILGHDAVHPEAEGEPRASNNWVAVQLVCVLECGNIETICGLPFGGRAAGLHSRSE